MQSVAICCLYWSVWKTSSHTQICRWKLGSVSIAFIDNCEYTFLILHENLKVGQKDLVLLFALWDFFWGEEQHFYLKKLWTETMISQTGVFDRYFLKNEPSGSVISRKITNSENRKWYLGIIMKMVWLYGPLKVLRDFQGYCAILSEKLYIFVYRSRWRPLLLLTLVKASWHNFWPETLKFLGGWEILGAPFQSHCDVHPWTCNLVLLVHWVRWTQWCLGGTVVGICPAWVLAGLSWGNSGMEAVGSVVWLGNGSCVHDTVGLWGIKRSSPGWKVEGWLENAFESLDFS